MRAKWTDETVESDLRKLASELGVMPSVSQLKERGLNGLMCRITRTGGIMSWAERIGVKRSADSDSDRGWDGEKRVKEILESKGFSVERMQRVKSPWDLVVDGVVTVDVKTAEYSSYNGSTGPCNGWFYRIGRRLPSDMAVLLQSDTGDCFIIPTSVLPNGNITITPLGKYGKFKNRFDLLSQLVESRKQPA